MAYDKVVDSASLDSKLTQVADAIRTKGNTSADLQFPSGFISAIQAIQTGTELQIIVSVTSGATVTATKGSLSVRGTSVNGTCTLTVPEAGTWSVKATHNGQTSDTKSVTFTDSYTVSLGFVSSVLNNNDWNTIKTVSDAGQGANYWSVGDRKAVTLNGTVGALTLSNYTTYAFIIGFNHNQNLEGTNRIHFQLAKTALSGGTDVALCDSYYNNTGGGFRMNTSSSNSGGWASSNMRTAICGTSLSSYSGTIIAVIPAALRAVLKSVTKYTDNTGNSSAASAVTATTDYFFLLSEYEVIGTISRGIQTNPANRRSIRITAPETARSNTITARQAQPFIGGSVPRVPEIPRRFVRVYADGTVGDYGASNSFGFAPGFCV